MRSSVKDNIGSGAAAHARQREAHGVGPRISRSSRWDRFRLPLELGHLLPLGVAHNRVHPDLPEGKTCPRKFSIPIMIMRATQKKKNVVRG